MIQKVLSFAVILCALAITGLCECVDHNCTKEDEANQYAQYVDVRDQIIQERSDESGINTPEFRTEVSQEVKLAVVSWVKANCAVYLGDLLHKAGKAEEAKAAYQEAVSWAQKAIAYTGKYNAATSQSEGKKILKIAQSRLNK